MTRNGKKQLTKEVTKWKKLQLVRDKHMYEQKEIQKIVLNQLASDTRLNNIFR